MLFYLLIYDVEKITLMVRPRIDAVTLENGFITMRIFHPC